MGKEKSSREKVRVPQSWWDRKLTSFKLSIALLINKYKWTERERVD